MNDELRENPSRLNFARPAIADAPPSPIEQKVAELEARLEAHDALKARVAELEERDAAREERVKSLEEATAPLLERSREPDEGGKGSR